jgi:hypothetical protein
MYPPNRIHRYTLSFAAMDNRCPATAVMDSGRVLYTAADREQLLLSLEAISKAKTESKSKPKPKPKRKRKASRDRGADSNDDSDSQPRKRKTDMRGPAFRIRHDDDDDDQAEARASWSSSGDVAAASSMAEVPAAEVSSGAMEREEEHIECHEDEYECDRERMRTRLANESRLKFPRKPDQLIGAMEQFINSHNREQAQERARRCIRSRLDVASEPNPNAYCLGDQRLRKLRYYLNNMGLQRSPDQINFHAHFEQAILPLIYGDEWNQHSTRVMRELAITELKTEVLCMTPRRFGKSWAIAMFVLAAMLAVPGIKLAVFSPGSRASSSLMKLVLKFAKSIPGAAQRLCGGNKERLFIAARERAEGQGVQSNFSKDLQTQADTSELSCFPSSTKGQSQCMTTMTDGLTCGGGDGDGDGERSVARERLQHRCRVECGEVVGKAHQRCVQTGDSEHAHGIDLITQLCQTSGRVCGVGEQLCLVRHALLELYAHHVEHAGGECERRCELVQWLVVTVPVLVVKRHQTNRTEKKEGDKIDRNTSHANLHQMKRRAVSHVDTRNRCVRYDRRRWVLRTDGDRTRHRLVPRRLRRRPSR